MTISEPAARARRYLLGEMSDEECAVIEQEYFLREEAVDRMAAAEDDLVEDYISNRLDSDARERFERVYLSVPEHRLRVDTTRRLLATSSRDSSGRSAALTPTAYKVGVRSLALAAGLVLAAAAAVWMFTRSPGERVAGNQPAAALPRPDPSPVTSAPAPPTPAPALPRVFAVSISPMTVRSGAESPEVVIPAATDVLALHLEGQAAVPPPARLRSTVRTVGGDEIWQGAAGSDGGLPPGVLARVDVPAGSLRVDDYVVTLWGVENSGTERELARYILRVREP